MGKSFDAVFFPHKFTPFPMVSDHNDLAHKWKTNRPWVLANMAHAAYLSKMKVEKLMGMLGARTTSFYDKDGAQAFLAAWPDRAILAFRGSQPREEQQTDKQKRPLANIKSFLGLELEPDFLAFLGNDVLADLDFKKTPFDCSKQVDVHRGFLREIDKLWEHEILPDLERHTVAIPVWVTGYSLGGAMATLAGMRYGFEAVVTFGEPRVGSNVNLAFKAKSHTRYVNGDDPVTKVPPELPFGYDHHGEAVRISNRDGGTDFRYDHSIVYYSENLA